MKTALLHGYFAQNFGDDLIVRTLCMRYPDTVFYAPVRQASMVPSLPNLIPVGIDAPSNRLRRAAGRIRGVPDAAEARLLQKADVQVYAGGSVFQQHPWWEQCAERFAARLTVPTVVLGASFGPADKTMAERYRPLFAQCADVAFRDAASAFLFSDVQSVRLCADTASYAAYPTADTKSRHVLISVISGDNPSAAYDLSVYENGMAQWCRALLHAGYSVTFAAFCRAEGDADAAARIAAQCGCRSIPVLTYDGDTDKLLLATADATYVIATRFHASLAAQCLNRPTVPVLYHPKQAAYFSFENAVCADEVGKKDILQLLGSAAVPQTANAAEREPLFLRLDRLLGGTPS